MTGGRLALEPTCLRFTGPDGADLQIELEELEGVTVSGSRGGRRRSSRTPRGTMFVAAVRRMRPTVWEFAIDRSAGVVLRDRVNRLLARVGRDPLPFVEALNDFPPLPVVIDGDPLEAGDIYEDEPYEEDGDGDRDGNATPIAVDTPIEDAAVVEDAWVEEDTRLLDDPDGEPEPTPRNRRVAITIAVVLVVLLLEALIPLLIIRGL